MAAYLCGLFIFFFTFTVATDQSVPQPTQKPLSCPGDAMSWPDTAVMVVDGTLWYIGTLKNTCEHYAFITVRVEVGDEKSGSLGIRDFPSINNGYPIAPGQVVRFAGHVDLHAADWEAHRYFIHKYGSVSVDADPNVSSVHSH